MIILPENNFNKGRNETTTKIERLINKRGRVSQPVLAIQEAIIPELYSSLAEKICKSKWPANSQNLGIEQNKRGYIKVSGSSALTDKDLLNICLVKVCAQNFKSSHCY